MSAGDELTVGAIRLWREAARSCGHIRPMSREPYSIEVVVYGKGHAGRRPRFPRGALWPLIRAGYVAWSGSIYALTGKRLED